MYAVIQTGGKQYRVKEGDLFSVEKLEAGDGQKVDFKKVLLIEDGETILVGTPVLEKAIVRAEVIETYKDDKILVFKKKRTKQFRRTHGHRQQLTKVRVDGIYADASAAPAVEIAAKKPAPVRGKAPEVKTKAEAPAPEKKVAPKAKKRAAKPKKLAKEARAKAAPKARTPARKTASGKPAAKPRKKTKE
jgi:large subunit ribosomal protein L21